MNEHLKVGDKITRMMGAALPMPLRITALTPTRIICGPWQFDRATGAEIDEDLGWGPPPLATGSYIVDTRHNDD